MRKGTTTDSTCHKMVPCLHHMTYDRSRTGRNTANLEQQTKTEIKSVVEDITTIDTEPEGKEGGNDIDRKWMKE